MAVWLGLSLIFAAADWIVSQSDTNGPLRTSNGPLVNGNGLTGNGYYRNGNNHPQVCQVAPDWKLNGVDLMNELYGNVTFVALMELQCTECAKQLGWLRDLGPLVKKHGMKHTQFLVIVRRNETSHAFEHWKQVLSNTDVRLIQETPEVPLWNWLRGRKDDFLIYDRCTRLTFHIPWPQSFLYYHYTVSSIYSTYYHFDKCGPCPDDRMPRPSPYIEYDPDELQPRNVHALLTDIAVFNGQYQYVWSIHDEKCCKLIIPQIPTSYELDENGRPIRKYTTTPGMKPAVFIGPDGGTRKPSTGGAVFIGPDGVTRKPSTGRTRRPPTSTTTVDPSQEVHIRIINDVGFLSPDAQPGSKPLNEAYGGKKPEPGPEPGTYETTTRGGNGRPAAPTPKPDRRLPSRGDNGGKSADGKSAPYQPFDRHGPPFRRRTTTTTTTTQAPPPGAAAEYEYYEDVGPVEFAGSAATKLPPVPAKTIDPDAPITDDMYYQEYEDSTTTPARESTVKAAGVGKVPPRGAKTTSTTTTTTAAPDYPDPPSLEVEDDEPTTPKPTRKPFKPPVFNIQGRNCSAFNDAYCYKQQKAGKELNPCCYKGVYFSDICVEDHCGESTYSICCFQKLMQSKFRCCHNSSTSRKQPDDFNRCCYDLIAVETGDDPCCPKAVASEYWGAKSKIAELCMPNVKMDFTGVVLSGSTEDKRTLELKLDDFKQLNFDCPYEIESEPFFFVPATTEEELDDIRKVVGDIEEEHS